MGGLADAPLRRGQAKLGAHRAVEEAIGLAARRPDGFVQPRHDEAVDADQARFEQPENLQTRMCARRSAQDMFADQGVEKRGIAFGMKRESRIGRMLEFGEQALQRLAVRARRQRGLVARDDQAERLAMRGEPGFQSRLASRSGQGAQRREGGVEPVCYLAQRVPVRFGNLLLARMRVRVLRRFPSGGDVVPPQLAAGVRPQHAELEQARQTLGFGAEPERKIRMRQQRRPVGAGAGQREQDQPRHHPRA